jgi:hypothetical protein
MAIKLGEVLVEKGILTKDQAEDILQAQRSGDVRKFGEIAVSKGFIQDKALNDFISLNS